MDNTVPETDWEYEYEVYLKLIEAEREEASNPRYYTSEEVREIAYKADRGE